MQLPLAYADGFSRAHAVNPAIAESYAAHTLIGDPALDRVMDELAELDPIDLQRFVGAGIEQRDHELAQAPHSLRAFFKDAVEPPDWLDFQTHRPAVKAFYANTANILVAFVCGVLIEGFSTLIAKSFATTGRVLTPGSARRRLMQNNRHLLEVFFPGGLERDGDGWKMSMRLRFVHARVRHLLTHSGVWDIKKWGTPISAAHLGLATTVFSMRLLDHAPLVGASFTADEQISVMEVWRYAGYVMGVPSGILFTDRDNARKIFEVACLCEPKPDADSATLANALIGAIPLTVGLKDPAEQLNVKRLAYRLSRALIGNELADQLEFPKMRTAGALLGFRLNQRLQGILKHSGRVRAQNLTQILDISVYDRPEKTYAMPDHYDSTKSKPW